MNPLFQVIANLLAKSPNSARRKSQLPPDQDPADESGESVRRCPSCGAAAGEHDTECPSCRARLD